MTNNKLCAKIDVENCTAFICNSGMNDTPGTFKCHLYDHDDQKEEEKQEHEESIIV